MNLPFHNLLALKENVPAFALPTPLETPTEAREAAQAMWLMVDASSRIFEHATKR